MSYDEIVDEICKKTGFSREEVEKKIMKKVSELSGLVTREGAAMLVAREFGLNLFRKSDLKIKDIDFGMKNFNVRGRIFRVSRIVEFQKSNGEKGRVTNIFISDGTGYLRIPLWNDQVDWVESGNLKVGDTIQVVNAFARENVFGELEISLGKYGKIVKIEDKDLPSLEEIEEFIVKSRRNRVEIAGLNIGFYEIVGTVVHIFRSKFLFSVCPICNSRLEENVCSLHGEVEPQQQIVISGIIDDGTGNIKFVLFREVAEKVVGKKAEELARLNEDERREYIEERLLGKDLVLRGRARVNKLTKRLEFIVDEAEFLNYLEESRKLEEELKAW